MIGIEILIMHFYILSILIGLVDIIDANKSTGSANITKWKMENNPISGTLKIDGKVKLHFYAKYPFHLVLYTTTGIPLHFKGIDISYIGKPTYYEINPIDSSNIPVNKKINTIKVTSASEMYEVCMEYLSDASIIIMAAAVADYAPEPIADQKIKKKESGMILNLKKTKDILKAAGELKKSHQILVGFALETNNEKENALKKLVEKNADMIVLNSLSNINAGFQSDTNKITIFDKHGKEYMFKSKPKKEVARDIVNTIIEYKNA